MNASPANDARAANAPVTTPAGGGKVRLLQIGTGRWGANHLRVLRALPIELYVCDSRPEAYATSCAPLEIPRDRFSTDHRAFLDKVDAVDVVTPADSHFALVREAISRGKDVFVEKPITLNSRDARVLVEEAERASRVLQVGYIFRHDAACLWARQAIRDGRLGQVRMIRAKFTGFKRPRSDSGVILADGIHFIDLAGFLLGKTPRRVTAVLRDFLGRGMDDEAWVGLEFECSPAAAGAAPGGGAGAWCTVECGYHVPGKAREVVIVGSEATARCDLAEAREKVRIFRNRHVKKGTEWQAVEGEAEAISFAPQEPLRDELTAFLDCVRTRKAPLADGRAGLESLRVVEAALASAREGRPVDV